MTQIPELVKQYILQNGLLEKGQKVLLAVSGGSDSMAMLHLFQDFLAAEFSVPFAVAHLNHQLRGRDSDADAEFVANCCSRWGVEYHGGQADVRGTLAPGNSLEAHARKVRYEFLHSIQKETGSRRIATAHTRDDQIETVLMRLAGGTGLRGIRGILPKRIDGVIRPLLSIKKEDLQNYLWKNAVPWKNDMTNDDPKFLRNKIRMEWLPFLRRWNPGIEEDLIGMSAAGQEKWALIEQEVSEEAARAIREENGVFLLDLKQPFRYPTYAIHAYLGKFVDRPCRKHVLAVLSLLGSQPGKRIKLPGKFEAWRVFEGIRAGRQIKSKGPALYTCRVGQPVELESFGLTAFAEIRKAPDRFPPDSSLEVFLDPVKAGEEFYFRGWRKGDTFRPFGLKGRKKVSDLLSEKKIPARDRPETVIMETKTGIAWVAGCRMSEDFKVEASANQCLRVVLKRKKEHEEWQESPENSIS